MRESRRLSTTLRRGGFSLHSCVRRWLGLGFIGQCCVVTAVAAIAVLAASIIDGSLFLPGRNIGLLEHPAIWAFFCIQIAIPISLRSSLKALLKARANLRAVGALEGKPSKLLVTPLVRYLNLEDRTGKLVASVLY